jgi:hypothetical protein
MNRQQYLLICLMEELAEVSQQASKCLRFTPEHCYKGDGHSNLDELAMEWSDLCAIMQMLKLEDVEWFHNPERLHEKTQRTEKLMKISIELGALSE